MRDDEKRFLVDIYTHCTTYYADPPRIGTKNPRVIINEPGFYMHYKRAWYLLEKWCGKDWYEYGTTLDRGWLTTKGIEAAENVLQKEVIL